jgi:hypothetical protein
MIMPPRFEAKNDPAEAKKWFGFEEGSEGALAVYISKKGPVRFEGNMANVDEVMAHVMTAVTGSATGN